jgi:phosphonate transport system ATP-binding protein
MPRAAALASSAVAEPTAGTAPVDLAVRGLRKNFGPKMVLDGIDLELRRGEAVALLGANGSGKSTLLRCCLRLVPFDAGEVWLFGEPVHEIPARRLRRLRARVGFIFQRHNLVPRLSVLSNVLHGVQARAAGPRCWNQALAPQAWREEAMRHLERVGLADQATQRVDRLSGGQSQRVAIARALMQQPEIILADEPAASLDPAASEEMMELLVGLAHQAGLSLLFASHQLCHALDFADRIVGLQNGRAVVNAPSRTQSPAELRRIYANGG